MGKKYLIIVVLSALISCQSTSYGDNRTANQGVAAQKPSAKTNWEDFIDKEYLCSQFGGLCDVDYVGSIILLFGDGGDEKEGLERSYLNDLLKLKYRINFPNLPLRESDYANKIYDYLSNKSPEEIRKEHKKIGKIDVTVWILTDTKKTYCSYFVSLKAKAETSDHFYEDGALAMGPYSILKNGVTLTIGNLLERLAIQYYKAKEARGR